MSEPAAEHSTGTVEVAGPSDAPPVVLVHGAIFNRTMWSPQREALAGEFRVIVPELPGHGDRRDEPFRLEEGVAAVAEAVNRHADDPVHLVGLSLGGYVATEFARRRPERVDDLVITGSSANPVGLLGVLTRLTGEASLLASRSGLVERAVDRVASWWVRNRDLDPDHEAEIIDAGFDFRPFGEAGREISGEDFRAALAVYGGPVLILNGQWDFVMRLGEDSHANAAEDALVEVVDGAGHTANLHRPAEYEEAVRRFVGIPA